MADQTPQVPGQAQYNPYAPQIAQYQRNQMMANALRQQSLEAVQVPSGRMSWTQGLAKVLQGYMSGKYQSEADQGLQGINQGQGQNIAKALRDQGMSDGDIGAYMSGAPNGVAEKIKANTNISMMPQVMAAMNGQPQALASPVDQSPLLQPNQPLPDQSAQPPQGQPAAQTGQQPASVAQPANPSPLGALDPHAAGPMIMGGDWQGLGKAIGEANAPDKLTHFNRDGSQAVFDPNTRQYVYNSASADAINNTAVNKQILESNYKPGSLPLGNGQEYKTSELNANLFRGIDQKWWPQLEAVANPMERIAMANTLRAGAVGQNARYTSADPNKNLAPLSVPTQSPGPQGAISANPVAQAAATAENSGNIGRGADYLKDVSTRAAGSQQRQYALGEIVNLSNDPKNNFGPGSPKRDEFLSKVNTFLPFNLVSNDGRVGQEQIKKLSAFLSAGKLGGGTDAQLSNLQSMFPNGEITNEGIRKLVPLLQAQEVSTLAEQKAATNWAEKNGQAGLDKFRTQWEQVADPKTIVLGQHLLPLADSNPQEFSRQMQLLPLQQRQRLSKLHDLGAF
jgi:hypothetical protein